MDKIEVEYFYNADVLKYRCEDIMNKTLLNVKFDTWHKKPNSKNYESEKTGKIFGIEDLERQYSIAHIIGVREVKNCNRFNI